MVLAIVADLLQLVVFPLFVAGAMSPADDFLDVAVAGILAGRWLALGVPAIVPRQAGSWS